MSPLNDAQKRTYAERGYLLASGLIPAGIAASAEASMWRLVGVAPDHPEEWSGVAAGHRSHEDPALLALYTPELCAAAAELAGEDPADFSPPRRAYAINIFPAGGEWRWPAPHIDHAIREHVHRTFPPAFRIACMLFLIDVTPHG